MKKLLQNLKTGVLELTDVPCPNLSAGSILVKTQRSLISAGTERMLVEFSQANLFQKARQQPEKVRQVLDKMRTDGILPTMETVFRRLDEPLPLGYCNAGVALEVGQSSSDIRSGDRVASNGAHAEIVSVPGNLVARIPDNVTDEEAAFTVIASIGLQGIRVAMPTLGERFAVFGLGLIGLITVQLLHANGCHVLGIDINPERLKLAELFGAKTANPAETDPVEAGLNWTKGKGLDGIIITASAKNDKIVHHSAQMSRKRGRIVLVGVVDLNLRRSDFYEKELSFQVSCSYGPGRYDEVYEQKGCDYPFGFVRWTEQRNLEAILEMLSTGRLDVKPLISHRYAFSDASAAYDTIQKNNSALGVILNYPQSIDLSRNITANGGKFDPQSIPRRSKSRPVIGLLGAGLFTKGVIVPALGKTNAITKYVVSKGGDSASHIAKKIGATQVSTDYRSMLEDEEVDAVMVTVQHNLHARFIKEVLLSGKHVFVEKPLAINSEELGEIASALETAHGDGNSLSITVGFNRRFSPHTIRIKEALKGRVGPLCMNMTVNAGEIPPDHWVHDPQRGGGRLIGEVCHFIDLLSHIAGSHICTIFAATVGQGPVIQEDKACIVLTFADGSIGTINYFANGAKSYPKETLQIFFDGKVLVNDNFRVTRAFGIKGFRTFKTLRQDKGHSQEIAAFVRYLSVGGEELMPFEPLRNVTLATFAAAKSANDGRIISL